MQIHTRPGFQPQHGRHDALWSAMKWCFGILLTLLLILQPYRPVVVKGNSMTPSYWDGELLLARRADRAIEIGDVIVFRWVEGATIKRVAKTSGEYYHPIEGKEFVLPIPSGHYYVLGDNPDKSMDSRRMGLIRDEMIDLIVIAQIPLPWS